MKPSEPAMESLLKQMKLTEPSMRLDQAIGELTQSDNTELPENRLEVVSHGRFGWTALIATAVAASVFGLLLGQFVSVYPAPQSAVAGVRSLPQIENSNRSRQIVPVKFNVDAFELMHGHSRRAEFANCGSCHQAGEEQDEVFEGWYYGDEEFFETHDFKGVANCSACHVFSDTEQHEDERNGPIDFELPELHEFSPDFINGECSGCHTGSTG